MSPKSNAKACSKYIRRSCQADGLSSRLHTFFMVVLPKYTVADIMGELKSQSALLLREKFDFLKKFIGEKTSFGRRDTLLVA